MPFTTTFATMAARGFGLFGRSLVLTTVTFPGGTTTWTAPAGTTSILTGVGKGSDGAGGYYYEGSYFYTYLGLNTGATGLPNSPPYPTVNDSCGPAIVSYINGYGGLQYIGGVAFSPTIVFQKSVIDGTYSNPSYGTTYPSDWTGGGWILGGTAFQIESNTFAWGVGFQTYSFPYNGANTTAFGYTWPGGEEGPASTTTYTNIPVTPGTTYTIVNNGSLTITYYA